jgi:formylglycine-generating enzyme required for sulfatase activity
MCVLFGIFFGCSHQKLRQEPPIEAKAPERELVIRTAPRAAAVPEKACPDEMTLVGGFCIDRWEAITLSQDGKVHSPYHSVENEPVRADSREGFVPQAHISLEQADLACTRSGKRLCTTGEWVDACRGAKKRVYPWGNEVRRGACNTEQGGTSHPLMAVYGATFRRDSWTMNDARINQLASTLAPSGAFPTCVTPEGVADMVGNLLEWTRGERPLLMGGHYLDATENGDGCGYVTLRHGSKYFDFTTGFRCCKKPRVPQIATDPAGYRSFSAPGAALPARPKPPAHPAGAACPEDMALAEGARCLNPIQECKRWLVVPGQQPERSCAEFLPTRCNGARQNLRYCIDRYEYTPAGWSLPLVHVSWSEASTICRAQEKRLCREEEWEFACEGPEALPYPYGLVRDGGTCNHDREELFDIRGKLRDQRVAADSRPRCKSPFGVFNLVGNVDEWTTRSGNEPPWRSILRGGWWLTGRNRCRAATESHNEIYAGPQTSFRCCKEARK